MNKIYKIKAMIEIEGTLEYCLETYIKLANKHKHKLFIRYPNFNLPIYPGDNVRGLLRRYKKLIELTD
jgi:hypothetical protein